MPLSSLATREPCTDSPESTFGLLPAPSAEFQSLLPLETARRPAFHVTWLSSEKRGAAWMLITAPLPNQARRAPVAVRLVDFLAAYFNHFLGALAGASITPVGVARAKEAALAITMTAYDQLPASDSEVALGLALILEYVRSVEVVAHQFLLAGNGPRAVRIHAGCNAIGAVGPSIGHCPFAMGAPVYNVLTRTLPHSKSGVALPDEIAAIFRVRPAQMAPHLREAMDHLRFLLQEAGFELRDACAFLSRSRG